MIARAFKHKLKKSFSLVLLACLLCQSVTPAFATDNGNHTGTEHKAEKSKNYLTSLKQNLAVFLADGRHREFILDRGELTASVAPIKGSHIDRKYADTFNTAYADMSISKAYAQIFKRTQVSWAEQSASNSLMLMGPDNYWGGGLGPGGGITISADNAQAKTNAYYQAHRMGYDPHGLKSRLYRKHLKTGWYTEKWGSYSEVKNKGLYKDKILTYLDKYFNDSASVESPYEFFDNLYKNATSTDKTKSYRIWAFISAGADATSDGVPESSPIERWRDIFESTSRLSADNTFIGENGLYEVVNGTKSPLNWYDEPKNGRLRSQTAAYFDTLLSLALMANINGNTEIAEQYLLAAKECFGKPGSYAKKPNKLNQSKSIIFDTWSTQCYTAAGQATKGTVVTYTDNWGAYLRAYHSSGGTPTRDWRSLSPTYNDYFKHPVAIDSPNYLKWSSSNGTTDDRASTDRIAIRLSILDKNFPKTFTTWGKVNDADIDISVGSIFFPALTGYGAVSSSLGRNQSSTKNDTILKGLKGTRINSYNHYYSGLDSVRLDMVGGQSAIFLFVQGTKTEDTIPSVQRISATPNSKLVDPSSNGLNKDVIVSYKVGNKVVPESKAVTYRTVGYDKQTLDKTIDFLTDLKTKYDAKLYVRTYITRQVTNYKLNTLWLSGSGKTSPIKTSGIKADTVEADLPSDVEMTLGNKIVPKSNFSSETAGWSEISISDYKSLFTAQDCVMLKDYKDTFYRSKQWSVTTQPTDYVVANGPNNTKHIYYPGYDFYLKVMYRADTQFKITKTVDGVKTTHTWDYTGKTGKSVANLSDIKKSPYILSYSTQTEDYSPTANSASFKYKKDAESFEVANELVKENIPYGVYSSSPEAYAELKNWGVSTTNEPHDSTGLGNNRSPMDTQLNVSSSIKSNGSSVITEDYEAMSGVPTTEKLYLAIGGSEFIVDIAVQYVPNETAVRSYRTHFDGVDSQFNYASASGAGGDTPDASVWANIPQSSAGASVSGSWDHTGGTITYTATGSIDASGSATSSGSTSGNATRSSSGGPWSLTSNVTAQANSGSSNSASAAENGEVKVTPNAGDVQKFNAIMTDAQAWINAMTAWINAREFTSGSDKLSRKIPNSPGGSWTFNKAVLSGTQAASGSLSITAPAKFSLVEDDGTENSFKVVTFTSTGMSVTNPRDLKTSTSTTHSNAFYSEPATGDPPVTPPPTDHFSGSTSNSASDSQSKPTWSITMTFKVEPHILCGPECGHKLPEINDVWQQSFNYDYLKIIGLSILRLDQGAASDTTGYGEGLNALIGTSKLGVTRQTYYSSPTMSLAQANIFNYMGYQTDGKKDVNTATNEYFRSIAYGIGTLWGNTRSSEAKRVQYWMTNADGSKLIAKGPTFQRLTYKGNTASSTTFNNEVLSAWGEGAINAHDYVEYNFGARSNLSDGTSRGYRYNVNKSSWVEKVNGVWRGKAAYDLPWAKGFIYDGVQKDGTVDASGYSVSRSYRNNIGGNTGNGTGLEGIVQNGIKGWQGTGMTNATVGWKGGPSTVTTKNMTEAYLSDDSGKIFTHEYYLGSSTVKLYQPAIRDWSKTRHIPYSDTRNLIEPGGVTMPGAEKGDVAPRTYMAKWWEDNAVKDDDRFAESQPYDHNDMLRAYTNTASDGGARIRDTNEFKLMQAKRDELVQATVISDALILDLPNGLQPIMYHYKNASLAGQAENRLPDTRITFDELWRNNLFTPNSWADTPTGTAQDGLIIGGYNGDLSNARTTGISDVQKRLQWRTDEIPATPNMFIQTKTAAIEAPNGVIGSKMGAKVVNGTNINLFLAHNTTANTRKLSLPVTNRASVGAPVQRTLLYNITPILLSADNREYNTGSAEAFWESIVQWKDSSNHDYYGPYVDNNRVTKADVYIATGKFIRLPELLGNYGQIQRSVVEEVLESEDEEGIDLIELELAKYFKDSKGLTAYGAERARAAQLEQYHRGYGVTGYNYDTTNKNAIDGKYHKNMYNESDDLTGAAKGNPYVTDGRLGVPFILEDIYTTTFKTDTAVRRLGASGAASIPKSGFIQQAAYTRADGDNDNYALNNIVIHNPVSARSVQIMPIASWRDQRTNGQSLVSAVRNQLRTGCPRTVELCEYSHLNCEYDKTLELLKLNLVGSGNAVLNTAAHAQTTGNIILAGNYALSSTGLSSNGSPRTGVSLSELGGRYYKALDYQVTAPITYTSGTGEQMLFGFEGYGITLNTSTKKLAIRVSGKAGYLDVSGTFNSGDTIKVQFGSDNASLSKVWVNGSLRVLTVAGGADFDTLSIGKSQVGDIFYIGSWNSGTPAYLPTAGTKYTSVLLERLAGSHTHTLACMTTFTHHLGGNNAHIHTVEDLGPSDSTRYLNGTLQDWNKYVIDDATLRERLGDSVWIALGMPRKTTEIIKTIDNILLDRTDSIDAPISVNSFAYTGAVQTYTAPTTGTYTFELWGAQGGNSGAYGQYVKDNVVLAAGQTVNIYVGGQGKGSDLGGSNGPKESGGFNGGGANYNGYGSGGGATDIRIGGTALSNRKIVAGGGAGRSHTGSAYTTHSRHSVLGLGQDAYGHHGAGGGGGYYGGLGGTDCGGSAYSGSSFANGAERPSNYLSGATVVTYGNNSGHGKVKITAPPPIVEKTYTFKTGANPPELAILVNRLTGTGNMKISLHKGSTATTGNHISTITGNPHATYPTVLLERGTTYTIVVSTTATVVTSYSIKATLTSRNLKYSDIMALPSIGGAEAWRQIPYYLPNGNRNPVYSCNGELNTHICTSLCTTEVTYDKCTEPHHDNKGHYDNDPLCFTPCFDDSKHNLDLVRTPKVNTTATEFVSIDWDYTLYADSIDRFRSNTSYQLSSTSTNTGLGYYDTNINGEFDTVRFVRAKYVKFPWLTLYDGILYNPGEWIVLGDRGDYVKANVTRANNGTGLGGNVQSGTGTDDLWHGNQAAEYNVQNWSLYNQQSYKDLYKDFYDFYVPLANSEMSLGQVTYATVAVNSRDTREPLIHAGQPRVLSETANINTWMQGNLVNNRTREMNMASIGAGKTFYVDVVGRIGGLVIEDTTDLKFSNTFKQTLAPISESKTTYDIDMADLAGIRTGRLTKALQLSPSIISEGKLLNASGLLPTRATLTTASDWVGFDYAGGNARKYIITVNGNNLKAGELIVNVSDTANGDYTLRLSDMTVTRHTDQQISVEVDVKQTNAAVTIKPRFSLIDTDVVNVYVSSMTVAIGGSGFSQGLNKTVDVTKQNYYITDLTDVRGIYLGATANTSNAIEGQSTLAWSRYSNFAAVADWIRISNSTQVRDVSRMSQRATPEYGTRAVNTYGTRPWVQEGDPLYKALSGSGGKALIGPLTSTHNTVEQHRNPEDQIAVGSKIFFDITTLGNYSDMDSTLKIIPTYYMIDTSKRDATGAVALIPVDVYQFTSTGSYQPVNIFGAPYGGFTDTQIDAFNQYRLSVNWDEEALAENNRRMITNEEYQAVQTYADLFTENLYEHLPDGNPYDYPGLDLDDPDTYPTPSGKTASPRQLPAGVMQIGGSQFVQQGYRTQTYIGSNFTYGVDKSGGLFAPFNSNPTQSQKYIYWQVSAQRWHSTLGLPSDAMFVPLAQDPITHKFIHRDISEIPTQAVDITKSLIIGYIDVYAEGRIWTLHYGNQGLQRTLTIGDVDYALPIAGPAGPAMANPYPGQTSVGTDYTNGGIPFGVFGGTRVEGQADIIKVN